MLYNLFQNKHTISVNYLSNIDLSVFILAKVEDQPLIPAVFILPTSIP
jgi:hypothetical protein